MSFDWNHANIATLKRLFEEKYTASEIADKMRGGLTRNAICGALSRLGLSRGGRRYTAPLKKRVPKADRVGIPAGSIATKVITGIKARQRLAATPGVDPEPFVCKEAPNVAPLNRTMAELQEGECRYVYGNDPATMVYCGHPIHSRMINGEMRPAPYCEAHFLICTQPRKPVIPEFVEFGKSSGGVFGKGRAA